MAVLGLTCRHVKGKTLLPCLRMLVELVIAAHIWYVLRATLTTLAFGLPKLWYELRGVQFAPTGTPHH